MELNVSAPPLNLLKIIGLLEKGMADVRLKKLTVLSD
jgi:hypothetical protein